MQREFILAQMKEAAEKVKINIDQLEKEGHFTHEEAEVFLVQVEKLYRNLSVYSYALKNQEVASDLKVHMKIMQNVTSIEANVVSEKIIEPVREEKAVEVKNVDSAILRKIELSINNRFRIANELFSQNQLEFEAALQQLNSISTINEAERYLNSLRQVYKWKEENPLVISFYALVRKRFA